MLRIPPIGWWRDQHNHAGHGLAAALRGGLKGIVVAVSSGSDKLVNPADPTLAWDVLADKVEALVTAWEAGEGPPQLADFVPAEPAALRHITLVELIKVDLEYRWQQSRDAKRLEHYLEDFPELATSGQIPCDLIYEEYHVRRQAGDDVGAQEFFERFPRQATELGRLLGMEAPHLSTMISGGGRVEEIDVGHQIEDFDLLTRLGRGAFATVFMARQKSMQRIVALKVSADRGTEPQLLASLDHPHIVRVYDQRRMPDRKLRLLYMQYIPGGTLQSVVDFVRKTPIGERRGAHLLHVIDQALNDRGESAPADSRVRQRLASATWPQVVCWLGARLASALDYAHQHGVLHRDVKPANVLVAADGNPKLADFNISFSSKVEGASAAAYFGGSLAYMSPEQLEACNPSHERQADELDGRSDVFSLGVMLWELLTGTRPYLDEEPGNGDWPQTLARMVARRKLGVGPSAKNLLPPDCPPGLEKVLLNCLAADPAERFASAGQLARQLELCLQPQVQRLLRPPSVGWKPWVRKHPLLVLMLAGLGPNIFASALNLGYNIPALFKPVGMDAWEVFGHPVVIGVNTFTYTLGLSILVPLAWPLVRAIANTHRGIATSVDRQPRWRHRCVMFAEYIFWISLAEWIMTGFLFPIWLLATAQVADESRYLLFILFMTSQILCGLIAGTMVFFLVTFFSMRVFYPTLFQADADDPAALVDLARLERRSWVYFFVTVAVLPLAIIVIALVGSNPNTTSNPTGLGVTEVQLVFAVLGIVGLSNSGIAFILLSAVRKDIAALSVAVSPASATLGGADTVSDSFWTNTR